MATANAAGDGVGNGSANGRPTVVWPTGVRVGGRTVYASTLEAIRAVFDRLKDNDPTCTSVVLTPPQGDFDVAEPLANAIRDNTSLASLKLVLNPEGDNSRIVGDGNPLGPALESNGYLTVAQVIGARTPSKWHKVCSRNSCLQIHAPLPLQQTNPDAEVIDLKTVPWARREDDRFLKLTVQDLLASGGFGAVYRITLDGIDVAAKAPHALLKPELFQMTFDEVARRTVLKDLMRELSALQRLDGHPNIVKFRGVAYVEIGGLTMPKWIFMDYVESSLEKRIFEDKVDFLPDVLGIVTGLEYIHAQGMIHRDVKPQNILVAADGTVMLADMGFVRVLHMLNTLVKTMTYGGTPAYLAPDAGGSEYDPGRDVYSFGVTAVQMTLREAPHGEHRDRVGQVARAAEAAPEFAFLFKRCCESRAVDRPSCRGLQVVLEGMHDKSKMQRRHRAEIERLITEAATTRQDLEASLERANAAVEAANQRASEAERKFNEEVANRESLRGWLATGAALARPAIVKLAQTGALFGFEVVRCAIVNTCCRETKFLLPFAAADVLIRPLRRQFFISAGLDSNSDAESVSDFLVMQCLCIGGQYALLFATVGICEVSTVKTDHAFLGMYATLNVGAYAVLSGSFY
eukprot:m.5874 g.5874  ORF g.5874 m.5874 type:complete len:632 (-) comp3759_c0_seq1:724-2619(-)